MTRIVSAVVAVWCGVALAQTTAEKSAKADAEYDAGEFEACLRSFEALGSGPEWTNPAGALYSAACCAARAGKPDDAFRLLARMMKNPSVKIANDTLADEDLVALHADARWKKHAAAVAALNAKNPADPELVALLDADQADRQGAFSPEIVTRDAERRARFDQLLKQGKVKSARDYWMAALLFQHGATVDDIDRARTYAKKANALQSTCSTRRVMALTEDRWLMYQHKPQKYGTQFRGEPVDGGTPKWVLYEVDPTVTDAQRAKLCVGPLSEAVMP